MCSSLLVRGLNFDLSHFLFPCFMYASSKGSIKTVWKPRPVWLQGSHNLEKYLNIEDFLEKSLKTKSSFKSAMP